MCVARYLLAASLLAWASAADAQMELHGRVIQDATGEPIVGATVELEEATGRRLERRITDRLGLFNFDVHGDAAVRLRADAPGYRWVTTPPFEVDGFANVQVEIRLDMEVVLLAPLEVVARSRSGPSPVLAGFEQRRLSGLGWFTTRDEIRKQRVSRISDILAMAPGLVIHRRTVYSSRRQNCPAQIYIDGFHINRPNVAPAGRRSASTAEMFPIDDVIAPAAVEGIEVYQGLSRVPAEFLSPAAACGVVAIWTRRS